MFDSDIPGMKAQKISTFAFCFFLYMNIHACRAVWAYVSGIIIEENAVDQFNSQFLGYINFSFLISLGIAYMIFGKIGDRMNVKHFILSGTILLFVLFLLMALLLQFTTVNRFVFLILMALAGIGSSTSWPGLLAIINNWFRIEKKVILLGYFSCCSNTGNISGFLYSGFFIEYLGYAYLTPIYCCAAMLFISITFFIIFIQPKPDVCEIEDSKEIKITEERGTEKLSFLKAWTMPGVMIYAFSFGCIKAVQTVLGFWLPAYLDSLQISNVALINIMLDLGTMFGAITVCYSGYYLNKRSTLIVPFLWIGTILMVFINFLKGLHDPVFLYCLLSFMTGFFIGGCFNNIATAIAVELSNDKELFKYQAATSTITSILLGYATVYLALNMIIVPYVKKDLFLYLGIQSTIGGLLLFPVILNEWKDEKVEDSNVNETASTNTSTATNSPKEIEMN